MAINPDSGEIYFVTEVDLVTHDIYSFAKVGLVRPQELAIDSMKAHCSNAADIKGILCWNRGKTTKNFFNKKLFKEEMRELFAEFCKIRDVVVVHKIKCPK